MKKSFKLNSVFGDMYFEDRKSPSIGLQNPTRMPAPSDGWNLEPKNQSERTLAPIMRREQLDDIMVNDDSKIKNKLPKKKEKSYKELGLLPTKKRLKFITENPSDSGHSQMGPGSGVTETNNENKVKPIPVRKPQNTVRENNVEWLDKLSNILPDGNKSFNLKSFETQNRDVMEEGYQLMPRRDFPDGFHKRPVTQPGEGHLPFMRGKDPGENLSKIPVEDLSPKPFFETKIFKPRRKYIYDIKKVKNSSEKYENIVLSGEKKSFNIMSIKLDWGSSLRKKYISELISEYREKLMNMAVDVWVKKGIPKEQIGDKWDKLSDDLDKVNKAEFIAIYNSYATELYGSYEDFRKRTDGIEKDESRADGLNPKPAYGDSNIYPYRGTGPMLPSSLFIEPFETVTREVRVSKVIPIHYVGSKSESEQTVTFKYTNDEQRNTINKLLTTIEYLGDVGSSRTLEVGVDGDGDFRVGIEGLDNIDYEINTDPETIKIWKDVKPKKSFKITSQDDENKPAVSQDAYDAFTEKSYVFKNYQLTSEQIEDAIDKGKDLSILLKYQKMSDSQKQRAINRAIEKSVALIYLYENEKESLTDAQYKALINSLYKKAMDDGTNLIYILRNFDLPADRKTTLVQKALEEGVGLHFLFKNRLLTPEQQDYAVKKAIETGLGLLDLLKFIDLTPEQKKVVINKCIEKGIALVHLLRKEDLSEEQKANIFNKALREGKGYHFILRTYKLSPDQINLAIRRSKHKLDNLKMIAKYQDASPEQQAYIDKRIEKMKSKKSSVDEKYLFVLPGEEGFEELQQFFREADDESVMRMYDYIENEDLANAKKLLEEFTGAEI